MSKRGRPSKAERYRRVIRALRKQLKAERCGIPMETHEKALDRLSLMSQESGGRRPGDEPEPA